MSRRLKGFGPPLNHFMAYAFPKGNLILQITTPLSRDNRFLMSILPPPKVTQAEYDAAMTCHPDRRGVRRHVHFVVSEGDRIGDQMVQVCAS